jgi:hypothetical protein
MKILLLDHPQHTHNTWMLYEGIVRVIGKNSVTVFPDKPPYFGNPLSTGNGPADEIDIRNIRWYRDVCRDIFEKNILPAGIPPFAPSETLTANNETVISYRNLLPKSPVVAMQQQLDEDELIEMINNDVYSLIVLGNSHRVPTIALARLRDRCKRLPPIIYFDAGERDEMNAHWWHVFHPSLTFKAALTPEIFAQQGTPQVPCKLFPMPLSHTSVLGVDSELYNPKLVSLRERTNDIVCSFGPTWPTRSLVQDRVNSVSESMGLKSILKGYWPSDVASAKIGVSMRGSGRDTERYWEYPAVGAALLADGTMGCMHPYPFIDKENAVFYHNLDELESGIKYLLEDEDRRKHIAMNGYNHLIRFHSVEARILYFFGILHQQLGVAFTQAQTNNIIRWRNEFGWKETLPDWQGKWSGYNE